MQDQEADRLCRERLNVVPDWIMELDPQGAITYSNRVVEDVLGLHPDDLLGRPIYDLVASPDGAKCRKCLDEAKGPEGWRRNTVVHLIDASGGTKPLALSCVPITRGHPLERGFRVIARDISDIEAAHKAAREVAENYASVLDNSPIGIIILQNERAVYANPKVMEMMGYNLDDAATGDIWRYVHPDDLERVKDMYRKRMSGEHPPERYEIRALTGSGELRHFELRATLITYNGGPAVLDSVVDITERKRTEQALVEAEAKYRTLAEETPVGIHLIQNRRFVYASPRMVEILGYSREELLSMNSIMDIVHPEDLPATVDAFKAMVEREARISYAFRAVRKDGSVANVEVHAVPTTFQGRPAVFASMLDVTDRVRAEEELQRRTALEQVIAGLSTEFINLPSAQIDSGIERALEVIGKFIQADRGYVYTLDEGAQTVIQTHKWLAQGTPAEHGDYSVLNIGDSRIEEEGLAGTQAVHVPDVDDLPDQNASLRRVFQGEHVKSVIALPMTLHGRRIGFVGFVTLRKKKPWTDDTTTLLRILGEMFVNALERKRSEEALRESEDLLSRAFDAIQDGVSVLDADLNIVRVNAKMEKWYSHSLPLVGKKCYEAYHGRDKPCEMCPTLRAMQDKIPHMEVVPLEGPEGVTGWQELYSHPMIDSEGHCTGVVEYLRDITERRKDDERLARLTQAFLSFGPNPMENINLLTGLVGELTNASSALYNRLDEGMLCSWGQWNVPADYVAQEKAEGHICYDVIRRGVSDALVVRNLPDTPYAQTDPTVSKYGLKTYVGYPVKFGEDFVGSLCVVFKRDFEPTDDDLKLLGVVASAIGVEERRKQSEDALRENEERYRRLFERIPDVVTVLKGEGFIEVNPAIETFGYKPEEVIGKPPWFISPEFQPDGRSSKENAREHIAAAIERGPQVFDWVHKAKDGTPRDCIVSLTAYSLGGENYIQAVAKDITGRKRAEKQAAKLSRLKEQLIVTGGLDMKLKLITDALVETFDADFARAWVVQAADLCDKSCIYAGVTEGPNVCRDRAQCVHLVASSGRYTHLDGGHCRVPLGIRRVGRVASGDEPNFLTNDIAHDPNIDDPQWASDLGLVATAGFQLHSPEGKPLGVLALFSKRAITPYEEMMLEDLANTASQVIVASAAVDALRDSEERYRLLFERSPDVVFVLKGDDFVDVNSAVEVVFGYKPDEVIGRPPWFISPELQPDGRSSDEKAREHIAAALESGPQVFDWVHQAKDGSRRDCIVSLSAYDVRGEMYVQAIVRDITDRKRAEKAVLDRQARLDSIFKAAPAGIGMTINRILTEVNERICEMTGYSRDELIGQSARIFCPTQEDYDEVGRVKYEQIETLGTGTVETRMMRKDGSAFYVLLSSTPIAPGDLSQGVTFTMLDITERKQAQEALERSEQKYKNLVETTDTGFHILDADGRVVDANAEYVRLTGYNRLEDILGLSVLEWTAQYDIEGNREEVRKCMKRGFTRDLEIDYIAPDGKITPVEINATVIDTPEGRQILSLCRDISERKRAEAHRRAFEKRIETQKRHFYRDTILSVTNGKLDVCEPPEVKLYLSAAQLKVDVGEASEVGPARREVGQFFREHGLEGERLDTFMIGVGEAITNAIRHANRGRVYAGARNGTVWVGVSDKGPGIESLILPRATLLRGFSTKPSLGLGYTIMLEVSDHILLKTGDQGTTVVLVRRLSEPDLTLVTETLPDTWANIPG